jgi:hypothetical protein
MNLLFKKVLLCNLLDYWNCVKLNYRFSNIPIIQLSIVFDKDICSEV